ncbi:MAG: HNH endonuclease signature motif containing protein [Nitrospiraceae bacterium]
MFTYCNKCNSILLTLPIYGEICRCIVPSLNIKPSKKSGRRYESKLRSLYHSLEKRSVSLGFVRLPFTPSAFQHKVDAALKLGLCPYCFIDLTTKNISPDHKIPVSRHGSWDLSNIEIVCWDCNQEKSWRTTEEYLMTRPDLRRGLPRYRYLFNQRRFSSNPTTPHRPPH